MEVANLQTERKTLIEDQIIKRDKIKDLEVRFLFEREREVEDES